MSADIKSKQPKRGAFRTNLSGPCFALYKEGGDEMRDNTLYAAVEAEVRNEIRAQFKKSINEIIDNKEKEECRVGDSYKSGMIHGLWLARGVATKI